MKIDNVKQIRLLDGVVQYLSRGNSWKPFRNSIQNKTGNIILELSDEGTYIRVNNTDASTVTVTNLPFEIGATIVIEQTGAGAIQVLGSGVTVNGYSYTSGQYGVVQLIKVGDLVWTVIGGVESV